MKKIKAILLILVIAISFLAMVDVALAKFSATDSGSFLNTTASKAGVKGAPGVESTVEPLLVKVVKLVFIIVGIMFLIIMIVSGIQWLVSQGQEEQIKKAQKSITGAVIGLFIIVGAYALTAFVSNALIGKSTSSGSLEDNTIGGVGLGCCLQSMQVSTWWTQVGADSTSPDTWTYCMTTAAGCNKGNPCLKGDYDVTDLKYDPEITNSSKCQAEAQSLN